MAREPIYPFKTPLSLTSEMVAAVDEWRRGERDLPPRVVAIRRLIELGLKTAPKQEAAE